MSSNITEHVKKMREERVAREQARIQKLRELNMKKYPKSELASVPTNQSHPVAERKNSTVTLAKTGTVPKNVPVNGFNHTKSTVQVNCTSKRPVTVPVVKKPDYTNIKSKVVTKFATKSETKVDTKATNQKITKSRDAVIGDVQKSAKKTTKVNNKPSKSNLDMISKPDVIITESSDTELGNTKKTDPKAAMLNGVDNTDGPKETTSKPDIIMATQINRAKSDNEKKVLTEITKKVTVNSKLFHKNDVKSRKSYAPSTDYEKPKINARKSMLPKLVEGTKSESVFDRLYKPKFTKKPAELCEADKLSKDPKYMNKVVANAGLLFNLTQQKKQVKYAQRRSISAVHFKRISKSEIDNCIHKWGSIDKLDKINLHEDIKTRHDKVTSAVKTERKKVQFLTPGFNTPRPDELQARLKMWLQKRGKSLTSYQHLQCFGLHHLKTEFGTPKSVSSLPFEDAMDSPRFDDENKENIALESDSDDGSYSEVMSKPKETLNPGDKIDITNWRNVSMASESVFNDTNASNKLDDSTLTVTESTGVGVNQIDDLLYGALNDLSALLREGFDWQQAARWLRSIRARFPHAPRTAAYWECRASLEDARGNLTASLECWNEAIAKGTEESVVDSNLDQLLNKFMQLKISPTSGAARHADPKLVDVKNVFKSTIIKFAVQKAKLRNQPNTPSAMFTVTPVRRSARLSHRISRTPLRLCDTVRQAATLAPEHVFTPNDNFVHTP